jgi:hypothetical protein
LCCFLTLVNNDNKDPKQTTTFFDGCVVPYGSVVPSPWAKKSVSCHEHQYVTYDVANCSLKYLLRVQLQ